ncbi:sensor histidine kinase [Streptomyces sp. B3I8]|uniref:sensor histidine kinase n=1 Tax=Streptomyces sp. B3I8 TaxID=3042303 RepID=UPI00277E8942|nr:sensor histidine kinase [Streptomyces sp. B3I8]MDQ0788188.1 signal transduction histidine kinase [Streptomyces sp. B3I8]
MAHASGGSRAGRTRGERGGRRERGGPRSRRPRSRDARPAGPRSPGARRREAALTAAAFALCLLGGAIRTDDTTSLPPHAAYVLAVLSCALLPLRHRTPRAVLAATTAVAPLAQPLSVLMTPLLMAPALITSYTCTVIARTERRAVTAVSLVAAVLLVSAAPLSGEFSWRDASRMAVAGASPLVAGLLGHSVRNRRAYLTAAEERARRAEETRESEARRRVDEERLRIARELHDLVAHQITLANAQAQVAVHLLDTRPEQTRKSLRELVETTGHALDELRATVGLLRQADDRGTTADGVGPDEPAPGLARLPTLLQSFRRAGLEVSTREEGTARPLPPGLDLTAYRIVQEALTNVTKHAGSGSAVVGLDWYPDRLVLTVADDGARGARGMPGLPVVPERPPGYGLIGMRERAAAVGGHLHAGRRPEGGFLVRAELPLPPPRDTTADSRRPTTDSRRPTADEPRHRPGDDDHRGEGHP